MGLTTVEGRNHDGASGGHDVFGDLRRQTRQSGQKQGGFSVSSVTQRARVAVGVAIALWAHVVVADGPQLLTWSVDGDTRQAIVYTPSVKTTGQSPLVLSFHGRGDNMKNFQVTDVHRAWPEAIVAYFQGLPGSRDGVSGWQVEPGQDHDRDLKLVDAALASLQQRFNVDEKRIYSTGFSNGAIFTYLLWSERPDVFAAFAPVAGRLRPTMTLKRPKPVIHVAGTADRVISFAAQSEAIEATRQADAVTDAGTPCGSGCTIYGADSATPVVTWIHLGGHEYPEGTSERIVRFFQEHPQR
jgi:polyhydroxybutyrate depolymerase